MMRLHIAKSWDFNQMLVASVFGHLLLITFVLFLPQTTVLEKIIPPAFMVELVEISQGEQKAGQKRPQRKLIPVSARKTKSLHPVKTVKTITPIKPIAPPKSIEPIRQSIQMPRKAKTQKVSHESSDRILNSLDQLKNSPAKLEKEVAKLARLVPKVPLKKPVIKKSKPIQETTFDEMNALKNKKVAVLPNKVEPLAMENPLDFDKLKMEETLDVEPSPNEPIVENKTDSRLEKLEFAPLSKNPVKLEKIQDERSAEDMLKELEEMKQPRLANKEPIAAPGQEIKVPSTTQERSQAYDSILKKLDSLDTKPKDIDTNIVVPEVLAQNFQSDIRKVSVPKRVQVDVVVSPNQAYVESPVQGTPGADALSLYVGKIREKVFRNWREPLGKKYSKEVVYSFNIYQKGNIDRLDLKKSSQVDFVDKLALRAIRDSEPFPKFPESLNFQNLNISIHFKFIPEKNKT